MGRSYLELVDFFIDYLDAVDFEKTRLAYPKRPIVIFCGGEVSEEKSILFEDIDKENFLSFRECLKRLHLQYYPNYLFLTPEEIDWRNEQVFKDLLEFEVAFSHLSTVIVVIPETPGALVELGMFSVDKLNYDKLLIIADSKFSEATSFINKGVFEYIKSSNEQAVKFFRLNSYKSNVNGSEAAIKIPGNIAQSVYEDVNQFIEERVKIKTCKFNIRNKTHFFSFLIDALSLFRVLSKSEFYHIVDYLNLHLNEDFFSEEDVKQFLMLMQELGFINLNTQGSNRFFYINENIDSISKIKVSYKPGKIYDKARARSKIIEFYKNGVKSSSLEKHKTNAINEIFDDASNSNDFF